MSGLADVLAGRTPAGMHLWPSTATVDDVARTVSAAGWRFAHLDGAGVTERHAFLVRIGAALDFPATYGANFDALADLLDDVGRDSAGRDGVGTVLLWDDWDDFAADERWFPVAREILTERASAPHLSPFVVLLRDVRS